MLRGGLLAAVAGLVVSAVRLLASGLALLRLAGLLPLRAGLPWLLAVLAAFPALVARHEATHGLDHAEIVVGVLVIGFGQDAVAGRGGLASQRLVFVEDLVGITADPDVGAAAIENLVSIGRAVRIVMLGLVMVVVTTAATAATTATAARPLTIVWSH